MPSIKQSLWAGFKRGAVLGSVTLIVTVLGVATAVLPPDYSYLAPILTFIVASLEKIQRNYREVRAEEIEARAELAEIKAVVNG